MDRIMKKKSIVYSDLQMHITFFFIKSKSIEKQNVEFLIFYHSNKIIDLRNDNFILSTSCALSLQSLDIVSITRLMSILRCITIENPVFVAIVAFLKTLKAKN